MLASIHHEFHPRSVTPVVFRVSPETHARNRAAVRDKKEHGGNFYLDITRGLLHGALQDSGQYNRVQMSRGLVDWHSHPMHCADDDTCALGIPSPDDIQNVVLGALYKSLGHLVYAKEGTYLIQVSPDLVRRLICDYPRLQQFLADLRTVSDTIHATFLKKRFAYKHYIEVWLRAMRKCGLTVRLFKSGAVPKFRVYLPTEKLKEHQWYMRIGVPYDIANDPGRLSFCSLE